MFSFLRRDCSCLAVALVAFLTPLAAMAGFDPVATRTAQDAAALKLEYRLDPAAEVDAVSVTQNGGDLEFVHFPSGKDGRPPGALLVMIDTSAGSTRAPRDHTVTANKALVRVLMAEAGPRNLVGVYAFANDLNEILPLVPPVADAAARLAPLKAEGLGTRIYRQGIRAVELLAATPATRKTLLILSDGKDEDNGFTRDDLVRSALSRRVVICAMGCPESGVDIPALGNLEKLAAETRGIYVQAKIGEGDPGERLKADTAFARAVLAGLNSGGEIHVPLERLAPAGDVTFSVKTKGGETFTYVDKRPAAEAVPAQPAQPTPKAPGALPSAVPVASATASPVPAAAAAKPSPRILPSLPEFPKTSLLTTGNLISAGSIVLLALAVVILRRRSRPVEPDPAAPGAYLLMQDAESRTIPLTGIATRIGRRPENDVVFSNTSVSGYHAEIHLQRDGTYLIIDLGSGNGLSVNEKTVSQAPLNDGDLVEMGEVRFRFHLATS